LFYVIQLASHASVVALSFAIVSSPVLGSDIQADSLTYMLS